jgi:hypothetical protein
MIDRPWTTLAAVLLPAVAFLAVVLFVYSNNLSDFGHLGFASIAPVLLRIMWLPFVIALVAAYVFTYFGFGRVVQAILVLVGTYIAVSGLLLPAPISNAGMTDISKLKISYGNVAICIALSLAAAAAWFTAGRRAVVIGLAILVGGNLAVSGFPLLMRGGGANAVKLTDVSSKKNIFVLSFDGLQSDIMARALAEVAGGRLKDFTFFDKAMAISPATSASIGSEVGGNFDYKSVAQTEADLFKYIGPRSTPNLLAQSGWQVRTFGNYSNYLSGARASVRPLQGRAARRRESEYLVNATLARLAGRALQISPRPIKAVAASDSIAAGIAHHHGPDWDVPFVLTKDIFKNYVSGLRVATDQAVVHFLHFTFTHHPVDFDADCNYRSDDPEWHVGNQTSDGLYNESICAVRSFNVFLDKLAALGIYDDALIVLKSDHGQPAAFNTDGGSSAATIRGHPLWGVGRYMPFLAVKAPGQNHDAMRVDHRYFALSDLATTLCRFAGKADCSQYGGFDLLDKKAVPAGDLYLNIVKGPHSNFKFDTHETIRVQRGDIVKVMAPYGTAIKGGSKTGPDRLIVPPQGLNITTGTPAGPFREGWSALDKSGAWTVAHTATLKIETKTDAKTMTLDLWPYVPAAGVSKTLTVTASGKQVYSHTFNGPTGSLSITFPVQGPVTELTFETSLLASPAAYGNSTDKRKLGVLLKNIRLQ